MRFLFGSNSGQDHSVDTEAGTIRKLTNRAEIASHLETKRPYAASAFAHLDPNFLKVTKWYVATQGDANALCLVAKGLFPTYMLTMGDNAALDFLLGSIGLPGRTFFTCELTHLNVLQSYYELEWHLQMKRMLVSRDTFNSGNGGAVRLKAAHVGAVNRLYSFERGGGNFTSGQIRKGVFYGIWEDDELIAVAGTHLVVPTYDIAYVGNVMTHPAYRNKGLAKICVSAVTAKLLEQCNEVVLNVEAYNLPGLLFNR